MGPTSQLRVRYGAARGTDRGMDRVWWGGWKRERTRERKKDIGAAASGQQREA